MAQKGCFPAFLGRIPRGSDITVAHLAYAPINVKPPSPQEEIGALLNEGSCLAAWEEIGGGQGTRLGKREGFCVCVAWSAWIESVRIQPSEIVCSVVPSLFGLPTVVPCIPLDKPVASVNLPTITLVPIALPKGGVVTRGAGLPPTGVEADGLPKPVLNLKLESRARESEGSSSSFKSSV